MSGLREAFDEIVADVPVYGDLDLAIEQADRERRRRHGVVAGLAAAAAVVVVIAGVLAVRGDGNDPPQPLGPSPTPIQRPDAESDTPAPVDLPANGRLARAEELFARAIEPCTIVTADFEQADPGADCLVRAQDVDTETGVGLFEEYPTDNNPDGPSDSTLRVATPDAVIDRFRTPYEDADAELGPGTDEISLSQGQEIAVVGFDGEERRTIDLSSVLAPLEGDGIGEEIVALEWSPDRTLIALVSRLHDEEGMVSRLWIANSDGSEPRLVHTAANTLSVPGGTTRLAYLWSLTWSPLGNRLGFIEELAHIGGYEEAQTRRAVTLSLSGSAAFEPQTLYDYADGTVFDQAELLWSPDGARVALRIPDEVVELSAEGGRVLDRHPLIAGRLVWLPRAR